MKPLRRTPTQAAILFSLAFILISLNTASGLAQSKQETTAKTPPSSSVRGDNTVMLTVTVTDRRRHYVKGLTQANFTIADDKQEQQIKAFSADDEPLSVGILFDASASFMGNHFETVREALGRFFKLSNKSNEYFLVAFNKRLNLLQDWTSDGESILRQIDGIRPIGNTALYDACYFGVAKATTGQHRKHALILVTDGQDNDSKRSFVELRRLLEEADVLLYSIGILGTNDPGSSLGLVGQGVLDELSTTTGGAVFFPSSAREVNAIFEMIAIELRNQYSLTFAPTSMDGKRHNLKLRVIPPPGATREMQKLIVRTRKNFYAK